MSKEGEDRIDPEEDIQFNSNTNSISISFIHSEQMKKKKSLLTLFLVGHFVTDFTHYIKSGW